MADDPFKNFIPPPPAGADDPFKNFTPPDWRSTPTAQNIATGAQVGALSGIRVLSAIPDLLANAVQGFGGALPVPVDESAGFANAVTGQPTATPEKPPSFHPWTPSEEIIKDIGKVHGTPLELGDDAPQWAKTTESVLPWLIPTGNQISRFSEAPGVFNKVMTVGRSELGNAADWFISNDMQKWAADNGYSPAVQTLLGIVGGSARHVASAAGGQAMPIVAGREGDESGQNWDANRKISPNAPPLKTVVDPDSSFGKLSSGFSAFPYSSTGEKGAIDAQEAAIKGTANDALQQFAPGSTKVGEASPTTLNDFSTDIGNEARTQILDSERDLKTRSDNLEAQIDPATRVSAQPIMDAALELATGDYGGEVRKAATQAYHRLADSINPLDGTISFGTLKTERTTFGSIVDSMFQDSTGERSAKAKDEVALKISAIETAMDNGMQQAADSRSKEIGDAWRQLDQDWSAHGKMKQQLAATAGKLRDVNADQPWATYATSDDISSNLRSAVQGGDMPVIENLSALSRKRANQAVAETIAAKGRPANSKSVEEFRPDVFGEQADKTNKNVKGYIEQQAPGAGQKLQAAINAAKTAAEPMARGGWKRALASVAAGGAALTGAGGLLGAGGVAALPFTTLFTSALHDPSFIRAVAGRQFTPDNIAGLLTQYAQHAGLGSQKNYADPVTAVQSGIGQFASSAGAPLSALANTILKYMPGLQR
jgi:hypothetical protein